MGLVAFGLSKQGWRETGVASMDDMATAAEYMAREQSNEINNCGTLTSRNAICLRNCPRQPDSCARKQC